MVEFNFPRPSTASLSATIVVSFPAKVFFVVDWWVSQKSIIQDDEKDVRFTASESHSLGIEWINLSILAENAIKHLSQWFPILREKWNWFIIKRQH